MELPDTPFRERNVVDIKRLQQASRQLEVIPRDPAAGRYLVASASRPGQLYEVALEQGALAGICTCPWAQHGGINCKHVLAALRAHYAAEGQLSFWGSPGDARRQHRRTEPGRRMYITLRPRRRAAS